MQRGQGLQGSLQALGGGGLQVVGGAGHPLRDFPQALAIAGKSPTVAVFRYGWDERYPPLGRGEHGGMNFAQTLRSRMGGRPTSQGHKTLGRLALPDLCTRESTAGHWPERYRVVSDQFLVNRFGDRITVHKEFDPQWLRGQ